MECMMLLYKVIYPSHTHKGFGYGLFVINGSYCNTYDLVLSIYLTKHTACFFRQDVDHPTEHAGRRGP